MRLEYSKNFAARGEDIARRRKRCRDFRRMMRIVVDDRNAVIRSFFFKAPARAVKGVEPAGNVLRGTSEPDCRGGGGKRIGNVVNSRHM